jgi:3-oxoacyl-[acyl-carrier protein] reductase
MPSGDRRVAVVTGAGQGIGRSVALALAAGGAAVTVVDLDVSLAKGVVAEIASSGGHAIATPADVAEEDDVSAAAEFATSELGPITTWVNNAGVTRPAMLHKMELADFDLVMRVHARGTFLGTREAARRMIAASTPGVILNVTSSAGLQGTIGQVNYAAAKGAIVSITKSAAKELAKYGIRVNAIAPVAATPMTEKLRTDEKLAAKFLSGIPLQRWADAEEIAMTFAYLASPSAAYITGQVICVDGGLYMAS